MNPNDDDDNKTTDDPLPDDAQGALPVDHPATDSNLQGSEVYEEGLAGAAEASEPDDQAVTGYTPPPDDSDDSNDDELEDSTEEVT